jgi:hypothetical protein
MDGGMRYDLEEHLLESAARVVRFAEAVPNTFAEWFI